MTYMKMQNPNIAKFNNGITDSAATHNTPIKVTSSKYDMNHSADPKINNGISTNSVNSIILQNFDRTIEIGYRVLDTIDVVELGECTLVVCRVRWFVRV